MVGQNRAALISQIGAWSTPKVTQGQSIDFSGAVDSFLQGRKMAEERAKAQQEKENRQAYIDALQGGDQEQIDKALAAYDPQAYAKAMETRQAREWQLADADRQFERQKELEGIKNQYAMGLKRLEAQLKPMTAAQQNMQYLQQLGYTPQQSAELLYAGQNPNMTMPLLGEKGIKKYDENAGKNYAADLESYRSMVSKMPELLDTVDKLDKLGANATYTTAGGALDSFRREAGLSPRQSAKDRAAYISMIDNQVLPLLRDTFGAQFTEREGNTLRKTLGDPNMHPEEKKAQLEAFIRQKQMSIESQARKLQSYASPLMAVANGVNNNDNIQDFSTYFGE